MKEETGGEDAYDAHEDFIIVADGVGGWEDIAIFKSLFSNSKFFMVTLSSSNFFSKSANLSTLELFKFNQSTK